MDTMADKRSNRQTEKSTLAEHFTDGSLSYYLKLKFPCKPDPMLWRVIETEQAMRLYFEKENDSRFNEWLVEYRSWLANEGLPKPTKGQKDFLDILDAKKEGILSTGKEKRSEISNLKERIAYIMIGDKLIDLEMMRSSQKSGVKNVFGYIMPSKGRLNDCQTELAKDSLSGRVQLLLNRDFAVIADKIHELSKTYDRIVVLVDLDDTLHPKFVEAQARAARDVLTSTITNEMNDFRYGTISKILTEPDKSRAIKLSCLYLQNKAMAEIAPQIEEMLVDNLEGIIAGFEHTIVGNQFINRQIYGEGKKPIEYRRASLERYIERLVSSEKKKNLRIDGQLRKAFGKYLKDTIVDYLQDTKPGLLQDYIETVSDISLPENKKMLYKGRGSATSNGDKKEDGVQDIDKDGSSDARRSSLHAALLGQASNLKYLKDKALESFAKHYVENYGEGRKNLEHMADDPKQHNHALYLLRKAQLRQIERRLDRTVNESGKQHRQNRSSGHIVHDLADSIRDMTFLYGNGEDSINKEYYEGFDKVIRSKEIEGADYKIIYALLAMQLGEMDNNPNGFLREILRLTEEEVFDLLMKKKGVKKAGPLLIEENFRRYEAEESRKSVTDGEVWLFKDLSNFLKSLKYRPKVVACPATKKTQATFDAIKKLEFRCMEHPVSLIREAGYRPVGEAEGKIAFGKNGNIPAYTDGHEIYAFCHSKGKSDFQIIEAQDFISGKYPSQMTAIAHPMQMLEREGYQKLGMVQNRTVFEKVVYLDQEEGKVRMLIHLDKHKMTGFGMAMTDKGPFVGFLEIPPDGLEQYEAARKGYLLCGTNLSVECDTKEELPKVLESRMRDVRFKTGIDYVLPTWQPNKDEVNDAAEEFIIGSRGYPIGLLRGGYFTVIDNRTDGNPLDLIMISEDKGDVESIFASLDTKGRGKKITLAHMFQRIMEAGPFFVTARPEHNPDVRALMQERIEGMRISSMPYNEGDLIAVVPYMAKTSIVDILRSEGFSYARYEL